MPTDKDRNYEHVILCLVPFAPALISQPDGLQAGFEILLMRIASSFVNFLRKVRECHKGMRKQVIVADVPDTSSGSNIQVSC
jgi:hypothetical protein